VNTRASSLPMLQNCPASIVPPAVKVNTIPDEAARLGTACHEVLQKWVRDGQPYESIIPAAATALGLEDPGELSRLRVSIPGQYRS